MKELLGNIKRYEIDSFGKVNRAKHPTKLDVNELYTKENIVNRAGRYGSLSKRNGIQRHNSNSLGGSINSLFEAKLEDNYYLIAKDSAGAGSSLLKYCTTPYTGTWTSLSTTEYIARYRFSLLRNKIYICNRIDSSGNSLLTNKVWDKATSTYADIGLNPLGTDTFTVTESTVANAGLTSENFYFYIVTWLYDGYQESCSLNYVRAQMAVAENAVTLSGIDPISTSARITHVKIYRSTGMDDIEASIPEYMYHLITLPVPSSGTITHLDTKDDDYLGTAIDINTFFNQKRPYKNKYFAIHKNRLIAANLETESIRYNAIAGGDLSFVESNGSGSLTPNTTYGYKLYKCYMNPAGGQFNFVVGDVYTKDDVELGATDDTVTITLSNPTQNFDDWCNYVLIQRTVGDGTEYKYLAVVSVDTLTSGYTDGISDINLLNLYNYPITITNASNTGETKFKEYLAISDIASGDMFDSLSIKSVDAVTNKGITGIFSEENNIKIFTAKAIYEMTTNPINVNYWTIDKILDGIGAMGQDIYPITETSGHNGILQLPNGKGYIFFNKATSSSSSDEIVIYFWNGNKEIGADPVIISDEINNYISGYSSFRVHGMCYDHINNWIWIVATTTSKQILVYDVEFKEWYVFTLNSAINLYDVICTENGKIIFGADSGYLQTYSPGTYQDNYSGSSYSFTMAIRTKSFEPFDADIEGVQVQISLETATATTTSSDMTYTLNDSVDSVSTLASSSSTLHRIRKRFTALGKRIYFKFENSENKDLIVNKITIDIKEYHEKAGGKI